MAFPSPFSLKTMDTRSPTDMRFLTHENDGDTTLHRSSVFDSEGNEWVVACGYTVGGKFGYFVIKEKRRGHSVIYSDQAAFVFKQNEKAYPEALAKLREIVSNQKR